MSGGVDSSVSALLLKEQGFDVVGLFMKNWEETDERGICLATADYEDVGRVASQVGIPYYCVNFVHEYREAVFAQFLEQCRMGLTPNPDVLCNREIKFKVLFEKARAMGADFVATGHYCRVDRGRLLKGMDPEKDQSYFLHAVESDALRHTLFPIGHLDKQTVRAMARAAGLATAEKKDSTGICFIGKRNFKGFLSQFLGFQTGPLLTRDGTQVGKHDGMAYYTIGQRKGIGLGGEGDAWYVIAKDPVRNAVIVDRGEQELYASRLIAQNPHWLESPTFPLHCSAKIRYRQRETPCVVTEDLHVRFQVPQRAIAPGQSIVFYDGEVCLGGAQIISSSVT
jgi:tRNA-uridine 2-sulfurtransferase